ncbi:MAG: Fic family protein, partial [Acidimicrobiia bacterium]
VVLVCRLAWIHPLPDGNKRAAWAALVMFIDLNHGTWDPNPPDIDETHAAMLAIAAGEVDEAWTAAWLRERVRFVDQG